MDDAAKSPATPLTQVDKTPLTQVDKPKLSQIAANLKIGDYHRHVFICIGENCCSAAEGARAWDALKDELKRRNLSLATGPQACFRTKVQCLRVCTGGPIMVVYPEGTYYAGMTVERIPEFVEKHLVQGKPIEEWIFARNPLNETPASS